MADPAIKAYFRLGAELKPSMLQLLEDIVPEFSDPSAARPLVYFGSYWGTEAGIPGQYNFLLPDAQAMQKVEPYASEFCRRAEAALQAADRANACTTHRVGCAFYHAGMKDLPPLYRQD